MNNAPLWGYNYSTKYCYQTVTGVPMSSIQSADLTFYVDDLGRGGRGHLRDNCTTIPNYRVALIFRPSTSIKPDVIAADAKALITAVKREHGFDVKLLSSIIGQPVIKKGTGKKSIPADQIYHARVTSGEVDKLHGYKVEYKEDNFPTDGYFLEIHGTNLVGTNNWETWNMLYYTLQNTNEAIYFVRSKSVPKLDQKKVLPVQTLFTQTKVNARVRYEEALRVDSIRSVTANIQMQAYKNCPELLREFPELAKAVRFNRLMTRKPFITPYTAKNDYARFASTVEVGNVKAPDVPYLKRLRIAVSTQAPLLKMIEGINYIYNDQKKVQVFKGINKLLEDQRKTLV
jgi:hypothetical protein